MKMNEAVTSINNDDSVKLNETMGYDSDDNSLMSEAFEKNNTQNLRALRQFKF